VKIYAQIACIVPFDMVSWEELYWFLKYLIPLLKINDPDKDKLDELLDSVDLSTYGLERSRVNKPIRLDSAPAVLGPQNPNMRGYRGGDDKRDLLDVIITEFNERWFSGWDATPEEQRIKFLSIARSVASHPDYAAQVVNNPDVQNRRLALEKLIQEAFGKNRKSELGLYKKHSSDPDFQRAFDNCIVQILGACRAETHWV
jgi:type I restriction enzyme R subunit